LHQVVNCYGYTTDRKGNICVVLEYSEIGSALTNIRNIHPVEMCYQIALGMAKLHALDIAHRDIKLANILVRPLLNLWVYI
jgi:serine/threonine protein kinase